MMDKSTQPIDLSQLAVDRQPIAAGDLVKAKKAWLTRYVLPSCVVFGFLSLFGWAARDSFLPAQPVTITPVVISRAEIKREGTPLFQAAGWVEPRPTPVIASSLETGVIRELLVIEGQHVKKGQSLATLIDTDSKLALASAKSQLRLQEAEVRRAEAALTAAKTNLDKPVNIQVALADAEALVAKIQLELNNLPFAIEAAKTRRELSAESARRKEIAGDAIAGRLLREARAELATATSAVEELSSREPTLKIHLDSLLKKRDALATKLELLTDETRALAEARANLAAAKARAEHARLAVDKAKLRLERMTVRSPIEGCVLSLDARPGQRLSGAGSLPSGGSSSVVGLYDPKSLQIRVDVRLEDVPQIQLGLPAMIETAALSSPIVGEVISVTTLADIQKNTLQVKVAVKEPPKVIRPEMLAKVTFLAPPSPVAEDEEGDSPLRLLVPQSLIATSEGVQCVWVADLSQGIAKRKSVEIGMGATGGGLVEVVSGLEPTDKLIVAGRESISEGTRIYVTGEDRTQSVDGSSRPTTRTAEAHDVTRQE